MGALGDPRASDVGEPGRVCASVEPGLRGTGTGLARPEFVPCDGVGEPERKSSSPPALPSRANRGLSGREVEEIGCSARGDCDGDGMGEMDVRWCDRAGRSGGGKKSRSASDADGGMSGSGSATSGLWHSGEAAMPLSDENVATDSIIRRWATLFRLVLLFVDLRGLPLTDTRVATGCCACGGVRGLSCSTRSTVGVRHEREGTPSSGSLSVSTRGLRYLRWPWGEERETGGDAGDERGLEELRRLSETSRSSAGAEFGTGREDSWPSR